MLHNVGSLGLTPSVWNQWGSGWFGVIFQPFPGAIAAGVKCGTIPVPSAGLAPHLAPSWTSHRYIVGVFNALGTIYSTNGIAGYWKGLGARVLFAVPGTAISWSVYEFFKHALTDSVFDAERDP